MFLGVSAWTDYRATLEDGWTRAENAAQVLEAQTARTFDASQMVADRVIDTIRFHGVDHFRGPNWGDLATLAKSSPQIGSIWVLDADGNLLASSVTRDPPPANFADREFFAPLKAGEPLHITGLRHGRVNKVWFFSYTRPIAIDKEIRGFVRVALHADAFRRLHESMQLGAGSVISLYRRDGDLVMRWPLQEGDAERKVAESALPSEQLKRHPPLSRLETTGSGGERLLTAFRELPEGNILVAASVPRDQVLRPFWLRLQNNTLRVLLAGLVLIFLGSAASKAVQREHDSEEQLRTVADLAQAGLAILDAEHRYLFASRAYAELLGLSAYDIVGRRIGELLPTVYDTQIKPRLDRAFAGEQVTYELVLPRAGDTAERHYTITYEPGFDAAEAPIVVVTVLDISERVMAERTLRESEERLRLAGSAARIGTWDWDVSTGTMQWSPEQWTLHGLPPRHGGPSYEEWRNAIHPEDRDRANAAVTEAVSAGAGYAADYRVVMPNGTVRWLASRGQAIADASGKPLRMMGVNFDITDRKEAEEQQAFMARELHHRVRNTLATVQAIVGSAARSATNVANFRDAVAGRIGSLAKTHAVLSNRSWGVISLRDLLRLELDAYDDGSGQRLRLEGPHLMLSSDAALALGMAVHELTTNAAKYGALSVPIGQLHVAWALTRSTERERRVRLEWLERDGPSVVMPTREGFGSKLLDRVMAGQPNATVTRTFEPEGLRCIIEFELAGEEKPALALVR